MPRRNGGRIRRSAGAVAYALKDVAARRAGGTARLPNNEVVAARREIMDAYRPDAAPEDRVPQIGTLSGNPVSCAAGLATLEILRRPGVYEQYHRRAATLRDALQRLCDEAELPAQVSGVDVMFDVYFTDQPVVDYRSTLLDKEPNRVFDAALLKRGVFKPRAKSTSAPATRTTTSRKPSRRSATPSPPSATARRRCPFRPLAQHRPSRPCRLFRPLYRHSCVGGNDAPL